MLTGVLSMFVRTSGMQPAMRVVRYALHVVVAGRHGT